jgi:transketolase
MELKDLRDAFFDEIAAFALQDSDVVILTNDMQVNSLIKFKEAFPERFINVGVAEQNMINVAAGLASSGKKVVIFGILSFLTTRCYEQLKINICEMNLPVLIVGIGTGLSFSFDGPTHHSTFDISLIRQLPNIEIYNPVSAMSAKAVAREALNFAGPKFVRLDKGSFVENLADDIEISNSIYKAIGNRNKLIFFTGPLMEDIKSYVADQELLVSDFGFVGLNKVWPIPVTVIELLKNSSYAWVIEENQSSGGLFNVFSEFVMLNELSLKLKFIGLRQQTVSLYGTRNWLREQLGMDFRLL